MVWCGVRARSGRGNNNNILHVYACVCTHRKSECALMFSYQNNLRPPSSIKWTFWFDFLLHTLSLAIPDSRNHLCHLCRTLCSAHICLVWLKRCVRLQRVTLNFFFFLFSSIVSEWSSWLACVCVCCQLVPFRNAWHKHFCHLDGICFALWK